MQQFQGWKKKVIKKSKSHGSEHQKVAQTPKVPLKIVQNLYQKEAVDISEKPQKIANWATNQGTGNTKQFS